MVVRSCEGTVKAKGLFTAPPQDRDDAGADLGPEEGLGTWIRNIKTLPAVRHLIQA